MPFTAGAFTPLYNWSNEAAAGNPIDPTKFTAEENDIATGLSTCILKDGTQTVTADIPWGGKKITNLGAPTSGSDAVTKSYADGLITTATFTITFTGMSGSTTGTATYAKVGNLVLLNIPTMSGTSNSLAFTATGLPAAIQPATLTNQNVPIMGLVDNNVAVSTTTSSQSVQIQASSGTLTFLKSGSATGWTNSGTKGTNGSTIAYLVN